MSFFRFFVTVFFILSFFVTSVYSKSLSFCTEQHKKISQTYNNYSIEKSCHKSAKEKTKEITCSQCDCYLLQVLFGFTNDSFRNLIKNNEFCQFLVTQYFISQNTIDPPPKNSPII